MYFSGLGFGVPNGGVRCLDDVVSVDRFRRTDSRQELQENVFRFLFVLTTCFFHSSWPRPSSAATSICWTCSRRCSLGYFVDFVVFCFGLVAFFFPLGWWGAPCRVFLVFSPWFSGGLGVRFSFFLLSLASCISSVGIG